MVRKLKALGLTLVAVFAISAMAASGASAQEAVLTSEGGEAVTLTGVDTGGPEANRFTIGENFVQCPGSTYTGHSSSGGLIANGATTVVITPHYKQTQVGGTANCDATGGLSSTVTTNGCYFTKYDLTRTGFPIGTWGHATDFVCPAGKDAEIHIYSGHSHGFQVCKYTITPQTGLHGGHMTNILGFIRWSGTITELTYHQSGLCGSESGNAQYDVDVTFSAHNALGESVEVSVSE